MGTPTRARTRLSWGLLLALGVTGCQCLEPVEEGPRRDGGRRDAGADAGFECRRAADCGALGTGARCWGAAVAARSCVSGRCVYDCNEARTCQTPQCLSCDGGPGTCSSQCGPVSNAEQGRLYRFCDGGSELIGGYTLRFAPGATCDFVIGSDAGVTGTLSAHGYLESFATLSAEPGVDCTVTYLATALNRTLVGCAQCIYLLESP